MYIHIQSVWGFGWYKKWKKTWIKTLHWGWTVLWVTHASIEPSRCYPYVSWLTFSPAQCSCTMQVPGSHMLFPATVPEISGVSHCNFQQHPDHWNTPLEHWRSVAFETAESFTRLVYLCLVFQHSEHHESILTVLDILLTPSSIVVWNTFGLFLLVQFWHC